MPSSSVSFRFHPLVVQDIQKAHDWYEEQAIGLGERFYVDVDARFDDIQQQPDRFGRAFEGMDFRFAKLQKFPYLILFRTRKKMIEIVGVFHTASNPDKWRR